MDLRNEIRKALAGELPGTPAQYRMSPFKRPPLSEYLTAYPDFRTGAVLILLFMRDSVLHTILIERPVYEGHHSGQPAFPGGRLDEGETPEDAAIRELYEEIGVTVHPEDLLGRLTPLFIPVSKCLVHPYVAWMDKEPPFFPDPREVHRVVPVSVPQLIDDSSLNYITISYSDGQKLKTPCFKAEGLEIWGATAMMISELNAVLKKLIS